MVTQNTHLLCIRARLYYYDVLCEDVLENIPPDVQEHIEECPYCQMEIEKLKKALESLDQPQTEVEPVFDALDEFLKLHFTYMCRQVTCTVTKPFLPILAVPALKIRIPTPITVHVDQCSCCRENLKTIHHLNLEFQQLKRLSQLFAMERTERDLACSECQEAISAAVEMNFRNTTTQQLQHVCLCPDCRQILYSRRNKHLKDLQNNKIASAFPCVKVNPADIFDYAVPFGIDPSDDEYAKFRESLTSHLQGCPVCLAKIQALHDSIYIIREQKESGIITRFIPETSKSDTSSDSTKVGPIKVEVFDNRENTSAIIEKLHTASNNDKTLPEEKHRILKVKYGKLLKPVAAAAAIFIAAFILFWGSSAMAISLEQIYETIGKVKNVHIARFIPGKDQPVQEKWLSRTYSFRLLRTIRTNNSNLVLWDFANQVKKVKSLDNDKVKMAPLKPETVSKGISSLEGSLGMLPFSKISKLPEGAQWNKVKDETVLKVVPGSEVYDLVWTEKSGWQMKWRVFVDPETKLPKRTEGYEKSLITDEFKLKTIEIISYPTDKDIRMIAQNIFAK